MRWILLGVLAMGFAMPLWASQTFSLSKEVDLTSLTTAMKQAVPPLEGCEEDVARKQVTCRRLTGEFTPLEVNQLTQTLTAHDAAQSRQDRQEPTQEPPVEIPLGNFGAGAAGALAALGGQQLVVLARKKKGTL